MDWLIQLAQDLCIDIVLLWVCWKMFRELREGGHGDPDLVAEAHGEGVPVGGAPRKTMAQAVTQILVADVSMSLDNVLAVAGAAKDHLWVLVVGLAISVVLMGIAATLIARLLNKHRWIAWIGLLVILYVAVEMIWAGTDQVAREVPGAYAYLMLPLGYLVQPSIFPPWLWALATIGQVIVLAAVATFTVRALLGLTAPRHEAPEPRVAAPERAEAPPPVMPQEAPPQIAAERALAREA